MRRSPTEELPTPPFEQIRKAQDLVAWLKRQHGLSEMLTHWHFRSKNCCGPHLWCNVGEWAIENLGFTSTRGDYRRVRRYWGRPAFEIDSPGPVAPLPAGPAHPFDNDEEGGPAETSEARAHTRERWETWIRRSSVARHVKLVADGVIGI